jgi:sortase A
MKMRLSTILGVIGKALITLGVLILLFAGFQLWGTSVAESRAQSSLQAKLDEQLAAAKAVKNLDPKVAPQLSPDQIPEIGDPVGTIEIPSVGVSKTFVQGVTRDVLRSGPGHYPTSPLPGQPGNAAIAGHRTTYGAPFLNLDQVKPKDKIVVTTFQGTFTYEIEPHEQDGQQLGYFLVNPNQTEVLIDQGYNTLTLTACHPKYSAKQRIIVTAKLVSPAAPGFTSNKKFESEDSELAKSLGWQKTELKPTIMWAVITLAIAALAAVVARRWRRWITWALASPLLIAALLYCFFHLEKLMPAV